MAEGFELSKETFLKIAEVSGLDTSSPHMEELYAFIQSVLPNVKDLEALDLTEMEPLMPPLSTAGGSK
jgi:Asp-tRNA(Asn)/Glu-tRNA(Gln) amidotransferase C subunit